VALLSYGSSAAPRIVRGFSPLLKASLRAAACGGRPRPARHDGHQGTGLTLHTRASQSSRERDGWSTPGQAPSKSGAQARSLRIDHPNVSSVMSNGGDDLDLGAFGVRVLKKLHALLLSSVGAVARPPP